MPDSSPSRSLDLSLRRLRMFKTVAKHQHFGRAAQELFLSVTALSEQIRKLEQETRLLLFHRTSRGAQLTAAGEQLLRAAEMVIAEAEKFESAVESIRREAGGKVRLGFVAAAAGPSISELVTSFEQSFSNYLLEITSVDFPEQFSMVQSGDIDACIACSPLIVSDLRVIRLRSERRMVMVSDKNPLAAEESVTVARLQREPRVRRADLPPAWHDWWSLDPSPDGSHPAYGPSVGSFSEQLELAVMDRAISIVPESAARFHRRPEITFVPIVDADPCDIILCARPAGESLAVDALFDTAIEMVARRPWCVS